MDWILLGVYEDNPGRRTSICKSTEIGHRELTFEEHGHFGVGGNMEPLGISLEKWGRGDQEDFYLSRRLMV